MFYQNQTIHHPDSPRNMNTESWLAGKSLRTEHTHVNGTGTFTYIDLEHIESQIAHGFIKVKYDKRRNEVYFLFKHEAGVHKIYGFESGYTEIPIPEFYMLGHIELYRENGKFRASVEEIQIGSHYAHLLPFSNLYEGYHDQWGMITRSGDKNITYRRVCDEGVLSCLIGEVDSVVELLNKCSSVFTTYLLTGGNTDLSLYSRSYDGLPAYRISQIFDRENTWNQFRMYWYLLNTALKHNSPEEVYDKMAKCQHANDVFDALGITEDEVNETKNANLETDHGVYNY